MMWLSVTHLATTKEPIPGEQDAFAVVLRFEVQKPTPCTTLQLDRDPAERHRYLLSANAGSRPCIQVISTDTLTIRDTIRGNEEHTYTIRWEGDSVVVKP